MQGVHAVSQWGLTVSNYNALFQALVLPLSIIDKNEEIVGDEHLRIGMGEAVSRRRWAGALWCS